MPSALVAVWLTRRSLLPEFGRKRAGTQPKAREVGIMSLGGFVDAVAAVLDVQPVWAALGLGAVAGAVVVGVIGRLVFRMGKWREAVEAEIQPQKAFTDKTPRQVVREAGQARRSLCCCQTVMLLGVVLLLALLATALGGSADTLVRVVELLVQIVIGR